MAKGLMSLVAIIDWGSRYVLAWQLATTLEASCCLVALERALVQGCPEIFNTDHGIQFTSRACTSRLERAGISISMDGRGRALDHICVERLWRTVKYEAMDLKDYARVPALEAGLEHSFTFDHDERLHQSVASRTPAEVHREHSRCAASHPSYFCGVVVLTMGSIIACLMSDSRSNDDECLDGIAHRDTTGFWTLLGGMVNDRAKIEVPNVPATRPR